MLLAKIPFFHLVFVLFCFSISLLILLHRFEDTDYNIFVLCNLCIHVLYLQSIIDSIYQALPILLFIAIGYHQSDGQTNKEIDWKIK